ncbi:MAG: protein-L-isoaspartate(D-aspartate) O-methyltransferase [Saprospiraceae bacterium]
MEQDTYRTKGLRKNLVQILIRKGITNRAVLDAIGRVPRHVFLDPMFAEWAYKDMAFPIDAEQTISQPYTVAMQSSLLEVTKGDKILEIGTGSGYQAVILSEIGAKVYTIERHKILFDRTFERLAKIGYNHIRTLYGDGWKGAERFAPYDKIIITAAAPDIPPALLNQLKIGGIMVIPLGTDEQKMLKIVKKQHNTFTKKEYGTYRFVPMLKGVNSLTTPTT